MSFPAMPPVNVIRQLRMFKPGVPHGYRFWSIVVMAFFYQLTGGVYLASLSQMVGELSFINEDITMCGYCSLIGLNIIFPMLFRWKFGLFTRQLFFISSGVIIACSFLATYVTVPWLMWIICFVAGYFKMMGMFGCMSSIQLNLTPTRNFAVFFPVIYILVCGAIQVSGLITAYVSYFTNWRMVHLITIVLMLFVEANAYFAMNHDHRSGPPVPLKGIDWFGQLLWALLCGVAAWIFTFGEHYDWWDSISIWCATLIFVVLLPTTIIYSYYKKEPYISLSAFKYGSTWQLIFLLLGITTITSSAHVLQPILLSGILHYDSLNVISLNYPELAGVIMGAILAYFMLVRWKWGIKRYLFMTFFMVSYYVMSMYFICSTETDKETMYLAMFALGVSEVLMETIATYYLSQTIPFPHFFMNITIIGFVRCGVGTAACGALVHRLFNWASAKSFMIASEGFTNVHAVHSSIANYEPQALLMALKESYGYLLILGILFLIIIMISNYHMAIKRYVPALFSVWKWMTNRQSEDPTLGKSVN